jgi:hypothetical protein
MEAQRSGTEAEAEAGAQADTHVKMQHSSIDPESSSPVGFLLTFLDGDARSRLPLPHWSDSHLGL